MPRPSVAFALTGFLVLLIAGCGSTRYRNHQVPYAGQLEFDKDLYECRRENTHPEASKSGPYASAEMVVNERMAKQCMAARGWRPIRD